MFSCLYDAFHVASHALVQLKDDHHKPSVAALKNSGAGLEKPSRKTARDTTSVNAIENNNNTDFAVPAVKRRREQKPKAKPVKEGESDRIG